MRRIDKILWSKQDLLGDFPDSHPLFRYPTDEKVKLAMAYFCELAPRKDVMFGRKRTYEFTADKDLFIKLVKEHKPVALQSECTTFMRDNGIRGSRIRSLRATQLYSISVLHKQDAMVYYIIEPVDKWIAVYAKHVDLIYYQLRYLIADIARQTHSYDPSFKRSVTNLSNLSSRLRGYEQMRSDIKNILDTTRYDVQNSSPQVFKQALITLEQKKDKLSEFLRGLTALDHRNWTVGRVAPDGSICLKYRPIIKAELIFKSDEFEDRNIDTILKHPYFIYDFYIVFDCNGKVILIKGKGYHPNVCANNSTYPDHDLKKSKSVCTGEFDKYRLSLTNIDIANKQTIIDYKRALDDLVIALKTVNLASAYWLPTNDKFLDRFQEYITADTLPPVVVTSPDALIKELTDYFIERKKWDASLEAGRSVGYWLRKAVEKRNPETLIDAVEDLYLNCNRRIRDLFKGLEMWDKEHQGSTIAVHSSGELANDAEIDVFTRIESNLRRIHAWANALAEPLRLAIEERNFTIFTTAMRTHGFVYRRSEIENIFNELPDYDSDESEEPAEDDSPFELEEVEPDL